MWSLRLTVALAHEPAFPEQQFAYLWKQRGLPAPACHFGSCGLLALQEAEQKRTGLPFMYIGDWQNQVDQLLSQKEISRRRHHPSLSSLASALSKIEEHCEQEPCMSTYRGVDKDTIETFLQLDGFYFDFYTIALSKMERGSDRDIADVKLLLQNGLITLDELDRMYQEVLAQLGKGRYPSLTPRRFAERYQAIRQVL